MKKGSGAFFVYRRVCLRNRAANRQRQGIAHDTYYKQSRGCCTGKKPCAAAPYIICRKDQSFFSAVRAKKLARTAPEMLCHTENTAPGMVASGYCAKWAAAREVARPEFCIPTSREIARHLVESSFSSLPTPKPVR